MLKELVYLGREEGFRQFDEKTGNTLKPEGVQVKQENFFDLTPWCYVIIAFIVLVIYLREE